MPARGQNQQQAQGQLRLPTTEFMKQLTAMITLGNNHMKDLEYVGFDTWWRRLKDTSVTMQLGNDNINIAPYGRGEGPGFDPDAESDEEKLARSACYSVITNSITGKYQHLLQGVASGDARHAFNAVYDAFVATNAGGIKKARSDFNNSTMISDLVNITEFIALIDKRAAECVRLGQRIDDSNKITVLLDGLLDEFDSERKYYERKNLQNITWIQVTRALKQFARNNGHLELVHGSNGGIRDKAFMTSQQNDDSKDESHKDESQLRREREQLLIKLKELNKKLGLPNRNQRQPYSYCGKDHFGGEEKCFKKKRDQEKDKDTNKEMAAIMAEVLRKELKIQTFQGEENY